MTTWIVLGVLVLLALYLVSLYNRLVKARQMAKEGWSGIDVQLKRRADLVPNLVDTVKGYMSHERETLEAVTTMRAKVGAVPAGDVEGRAKAEGLLGQALGRLLAVAENYPDLKASTNFQTLQLELSNLENEIQMSRRYYNGAARELNVMVESFPSNLVAGQFGFASMDYFEIENAADRAVPKVGFNG